LQNVKIATILLYYYISNSHSLQVKILKMIFYISHCAVNASTIITSQTQNRKPRIPQRSSSVLYSFSSPERIPVIAGHTEEESRSDIVDN